MVSDLGLHCLPMTLLRFPALLQQVLSFKANPREEGKKTLPDQTDLPWRCILHHNSIFDSTYKMTKNLHNRAIFLDDFVTKKYITLLIT